MNKNIQSIVAMLLLVVFTFGMTTDAEAQRKKKKKKKKGDVENVQLPDRIIESDTSMVCNAFSSSDPNLAQISQNFADMNLRRRFGDFSENEYSSIYYWEKVYEAAPGFSVLVYTDGSFIHTRMAEIAKENGDEEKFKSHLQMAEKLLKEGEKCYPETVGLFGPSYAYIKQLQDPGAYQEIFGLYTQGFNDDTDPFSLIEIARYAKYMSYIDELTPSEGDEWVKKTLAVAEKKKSIASYEYAFEQIKAVEEQYAEYEQQAAQATTTTTQTGSTEGNELNNSYNKMVEAANANNLTAAMSEFRNYIQLETDASRKYEMAMYIGSINYSGNNYTQAREAFRVAAQADPSNGEPNYYIGMMYLSSGELCGPGTGFDSQRVIWPAFDQINIALSKNLSAELQADARSTMATYREFLPAPHQLQEQGLIEGQTYTVPCWINEVTTVRAN